MFEFAPELSANLTLAKVDLEYSHVYASASLQNDRHDDAGGTFAGGSRPIGTDRLRLIVGTGPC